MYDLSRVGRSCLLNKRTTALALQIGSLTLACWLHFDNVNHFPFFPAIFISKGILTRRYATTTEDLDMDDPYQTLAQARSANAAFTSKSTAMGSKPNPEFTPDAYPPLPSNLETVHLPILSITDLAKPFPDKDSTFRLFQACKSPGIFYLKPPAKMGPNDAMHPHDSLIVRATDWVTKLEPAFHLPIDEKMKYCFKDSTRIFGYKQVGATVVDGAGTGDTSEFWNVSDLPERFTRKMQTVLQDSIWLLKNIS